MPIHIGKNSKGSFYQWGTSGKKYYYQPGCATCRENAKKNAGKQARAIYASGYRKK